MAKDAQDAQLRAAENRHRRCPPATAAARTKRRTDPARFPSDDILPVVCISQPLWRRTRGTSGLAPEVPFVSPQRRTEPAGKNTKIGGVPRDYFEGPFLDDQTVPVPARYARELAHKLRDAVGLHSLSYVAQKAGVPVQTVAAILEGSCWPDLVTIAKLEYGLGKRLWPDLVKD